jgi:hypothetical protein
MLKIKLCPDCGKRKTMLEADTNCGCVQNRRIRAIAVLAWHRLSEPMTEQQTFDAVRNDMTPLDLTELRRALNALVRIGCAVFTESAYKRRTPKDRYERKVKLERLLNAHIV